MSPLCPPRRAWRGVLSLGRQSQSGAQAHTSPPVGLELSRLFGWGQELAAKCESEIETKDPLRQNNQQNAKPTNSKSPQTTAGWGEGWKPRSCFCYKEPQPGGHCAPPGLCFPRDAAAHFPPRRRARRRGLPDTGRPHNPQGPPGSSSFLIVGERSKRRFLGYNAVVI